jgi:hypothetical protein
MSGSSARRVLDAIERLPADAAIEETIERVVFMAKVERRLAELDAGQGINHSEVKASALPLSRIVWAPQAGEDVEAITACGAGDSVHYADLLTASSTASDRTSSRS